MPGLAKSTPIFDKVIVGFVVCATNLNHTSLVTPVAQFGALMVVAVTVDPYIFPVVLIQDEEDVIKVEPAQRSLKGASMMQILKFQSAGTPADTLLPPVNTLTR